MKARLILIAAAGALLGTLALAPPAEAGHWDWSFGAGFHVGGLHFRVGFGPPGYGHYPGPFFVTDSRLRHRGYGCHDACFRRGPSYYHHASCPLVGFHFQHGGYGPGHYVRQYSPYRGYGPYWGPRYNRYPSRPYGYYYRPGYRDPYWQRGGRYYRDRHYRDHRYRGHRGDHRYRGHRGDHRYRNDRRRPDYDHDSDSDRGRDRGRHYRGEQQRGGRDHAQPRRGAARTRPPR